MRYCACLVSLAVMFSFAFAEEKGLPVSWDEMASSENGAWTALRYKRGMVPQPGRSYWPEKRQTIESCLKANPKGLFSGDLALALALGLAQAEHAYEESLRVLRDAEKDYGHQNSILGCSFSLEDATESNSIWAFDPVWEWFRPDLSARNGASSRADAEWVMYFTHLQRFPRRVCDMARIYRFVLLKKQGKLDLGLEELTKFTKEKALDIQRLAKADREAANDPAWQRLQTIPTWYGAPVIDRPEWYAFFLLSGEEEARGHHEKAVTVMQPFVAAVTPDGWYWTANLAYGDLLAKADPEKAIAQYELARAGFLRTASASVAIRAKIPGCKANDLPVKQWTRTLEMLAQREAKAGAQRRPDIQADIEALKSVFNQSQAPVSKNKTYQERLSDAISAVYKGQTQASEGADPEDRNAFFVSAARIKEVQRICGDFQREFAQAGEKNSVIEKRRLLAGAIGALTEEEPDPGARKVFCGIIRRLIRYEGPAPDFKQFPIVVRKIDAYVAQMQNALAGKPIDRHMATVSSERKADEKVVDIAEALVEYYVRPLEEGWESAVQFDTSEDEKAFERRVKDEFPRPNPDAAMAAELYMLELAKDAKRPLPIREALIDVVNRPVCLEALLWLLENDANRETIADRASNRISAILNRDGMLDESGVLRPKATK